MTAAESITAAIRAANTANRPALIPFVTAGYPDKESFAEILNVLDETADVIELGVPFTDPLADGVTIQHSSEVALKAGVSLGWILETLQKTAAQRQSPILLMSYLNPLLSLGYDNLAEKSVAAGVSGFIVPDLPFEESGPLREQLETRGLALVQLVSPVTTPERIKMLCAASKGFVYAVTVTGVTGGDGAAVDNNAVYQYLDSVRQVSDLPVCAGFGIRDATQVEQIGAHADGVIVGSALIEVLQRQDDLRLYLRTLGGKHND